MIGISTQEEHHSPHGNNRLSGNHQLQTQDPNPQIPHGNNRLSGKPQLQIQGLILNNGPKFPTKMEETTKTEELPSITLLT
jgi:hypothetical protein